MAKASIFKNYNLPKEAHMVKPVTYATVFGHLSFDYSEAEVSHGFWLGAQLNGVMSNV